MDKVLEKSLTITRFFKVSPEVLWEIWTDEKKISQWHRPNTKDYVTVATSDTRVGGAFRISMTEKSGTYTAFGRYEEMKPPHRLVYSWQWENDPSGEISRVILELRAVEGGTELTLNHAQLSGPESVKSHLKGWLGCLVNLEALIP